MPPSFGNRDDSSATANPCGMKKKTAAINHISNDPGPNFAVVPRCLRPRTATRLNRIRSRSLSARTRCGAVCFVFVTIKLEKGTRINYRKFSWEMIDEQNAIELEERFYRMVKLESRGTKRPMKMHHYRTRSAILLLMVSLFFIVFVASRSVGADSRSPHAAAPSQAPARLIIRRNPNLGVNVIVRLWIDG